MIIGARNRGREGTNKADKLRNHNDKFVLPFYISGAAGLLSFYVFLGVLSELRVEVGLIETDEI